MKIIHRLVKGDDQWTNAVHHSSTKAKSGNHPENGLLSFSGRLFSFFFGEAKKNKWNNANQLENKQELIP